MKKYYKYLIGSAAWLLPMLVLAAGEQLKTLLGNINSAINLIIPFLLGLAGLVFIWGVFQFITSAGDEEKRKSGRDFIIYGLVGFVIMVGFWGLVNILINVFGLGAAPPTTLPTLPTLP